MHLPRECLGVHSSLEATKIIGRYVTGNTEAERAIHTLAVVSETCKKIVSSEFVRCQPRIPFLKTDRFIKLTGCLFFINVGTWYLNKLATKIN